MQIKTIPLGNIGANCYTVSSDNAAIVIDPGEFSQEVCTFLEENKEKQRLILLTHCHFDHIGGAKKLREITGTKIAIGEKEFDATLSSSKTLSDYFGIFVDRFKADIPLKNGEVLNVGDLEIRCIETPGHTVGGMCYLFENSLFSGDTLFRLSIGRTDFPDGSFKEISRSIKMLYEVLPDDTVVFPGHGEDTLIGYEKNYNPYVRDI